MPFQTAVLIEPAPGLEGGWASNNVWTSMVNPNNGDPTAPGYTSWQVGPAGLTVGRFAFADTTTGLVHRAHPGTATVRVGFVHRYQPALIIGYLGQAGSDMVPGQEVDITDGGDYWARFAAAPTLGAKVFANLADGTALTGAAGATITGAAVTVTTTNGSPNLTALSAALPAGSVITGTGIPANTYIVTGGAAGGTAVMSANATASGTVAVTPTTALETRWYADTPAPAGGLSKITPRG